MTKIALSSWTLIFPPYDEKPESFESVLDRAAAIGYDGVETAWFAPHPSVGDLDSAGQRDAYMNAFHSRGLDVAGVVANFDDAESFLTSEDNSSYLDVLDRQLALCNALGIDLLRLDIPEPPQVVTTLDYDTAYERLISTWEEAARRGEAHGVRVGWEFEPGTPFNRPSEIFRVVDDVQHPWFGIIYDTTQAHNCALGLGQVGEPETLPGGQLEFLQRLAGRITHVHLIDSNGQLADGRFSRHIPFGEGDIDWESVMPALVEAGSGDEWWTVDVCWIDDAWSVFERALPFVDDLRTRYGD
jgi:sugar phosphate isomerase/epimerase